ncbi:rod shape-determining protein [candidate division WWE3 bacterium RIFOXYC1_FULL_39_7]|uniref:Cell shape-determining protein MreB n=2 Tax=Katanobacteria TaxID=422282 RepID=A0A1F4X5V8_UNCKA|nr:MAG: rod shape-determining protein [candidate division WWE3 bacterium RIFOXYC1_FULL_39_7]OGC77075.1 MAG: rod shape-determining protein [candidate division WWE3 bacterium RIFOXYD1_FULL_39_9]
MFGKKIAIDLGTANSLVYVSGKGILLREPTVVAVSIDDDRVVAVGNEAREMIGKTPENIVATKPLRDGVIADYVVTEALLRYFINKVMGRYRFVRPDVMISIPAGATSVEARAVLEAAYSAGAKRAFLIPEPLAAAIGSGLPISEPSGNMVVNIGGGTTEIAIVSLYGMVVHGSVRVGGNVLDDNIATHIRRKYGLVIGDNTAEMVKMEIGEAVMPIKDRFMEVKGRDSVTGFPKTITVSSSEISTCMAQSLNQIAQTIKGVLEKTPPELSSDIIDKGIVLSGGTALLGNLDKHISEFTGVPVHIADDPLLCVVRGLSKALDNLDTFSKSMIKR